MSESLGFSLLKLSATEIEVKSISKKKNQSSTLSISFEDTDESFAENGQITILAEVNLTIRNFDFKIELLSVLEVDNPELLSYDSIIVTHKHEITKPVLLKASNLLATLNDQVSEYPILIDLHDILIRREKEELAK
ncbi:hypothetical protein I6N95_04925 [Vagococcus sp. BWB3-3]|uniref:Uncharacterized protein n=1 Tax=Vagococcus allomyrinae TaxID=2794353 RepID=A0A940P9D6_9ENTE|nr:hypothetical protein [Vagococcus allomyrinae]MBP1040352.1 hypothetical protein [Vagococcus allomyrinae]